MQDINKKDATADKIAQIDKRIAMTADPIATGVLYAERDKLMRQNDNHNINPRHNYGEFCECDECTGKP